MRSRGCLLLALLCACPGPKQLTRDQMLDAENCKTCHVDHYDDWASSMHAYASDDPVFRAMNQRGQRETGGQLGNFCVNCHAPMAVQEGATTDGLDLATVPQSLKGVTCYFCHSVDQVNGTHDNPLHLSSDLAMRGQLSDAISNSGHASVYSDLLDRTTLGSAALCGSCHDIVTGHGASIERTFGEWQGSVFAQAPGGETCSQCHMRESHVTQPIAQFQGAPPRYFHAHTFEGVDVALTPWPDAGVQRALIQSFLDDRTLQTAVCVDSTLGNLKVILDNVGAGHAWPSGSAQDRRAWVELVAYGDDGGILYQSGVVPDGGEVTALDGGDLWLMRDCMFDEAGNQVSMFWNAAGDAGTEGNELTALQTFDMSDARFYQTHIIRTFGQGAALPAPSRVTARVRIQPIGMDVLDDLVDGGDLDPAVRGAMPTFTVAHSDALEWTPAATTGYIDPGTGFRVSCVTNNFMTLQTNHTPAAGHTRCGP